MRKLCVSYFLKEFFMCFSIHIDRNIKNLAKIYGATISHRDYQNFKNLQEYELSLWQERQGKLDATEVKKFFGLKGNPRKRPYLKVPDQDDRVYNKTFMHIITRDEKSSQSRIIKPARYGMRELAKLDRGLNLFNIRLERLIGVKEKRSEIWDRVLFQKHCLIPYYGFYEKVQRNEKSNVLIKFKKKDNSLMTSPGLWQRWYSKDRKYYFDSFGLITTTPRPEVLHEGHDRSPIILTQKGMDQWLSLENQDTRELLNFEQISKELCYELP